MSHITKRGMLKGLAGLFGAAYMAHEVKEEASVEISRSLFEETVPARLIQPDIDKIVEKIEERLERVPQGRTLFLPIGEVHSISCHRMVQRGVLLALKERGYNVAFGYEQPYNTAAEAARNFTPITQMLLLQSEERRENGNIRFERCNALGHSSVQLATLSQYNDADTSVKILLHDCLKNDIPVRFNDLALIEKDGVSYLDMAAPLFEEMTQASQQLSAGKDIPSAEPEGLYLRNRAMVTNARLHAQETGADIYVQQCGRGHLVEGPLTGTQTLRGLFEESEEEVLGVDLGPEFAANLGGISLRPDILNIHGLPNRSYTFQSARALMDEVRYIGDLTGEDFMPLYKDILSGAAYIPYDEALCREDNSLSQRLEKYYEYRRAAIPSFGAQ